jgi:hypothetical protein
VIVDLTLEGEDLGWDPDTERVLRREVRRLELALVRREKDDDAELRVTRRVREDRVELQFLLRYPDGTEERADRLADDEKAAIPELVDELLTDLEDQDQAVDSVLTVFHALRRAARREVTLAELEGRLEEGAVDPDDVVDSAVADLLPRLSPSASPAQAFEQLERRVIERLNAPAQPEPASDTLDRPFAEAWPTEDADEPWNPEPQPFALTELVADPETFDQEEVLADREVRARLVRALFRLERRVRLTWEEVVLNDGSVGRVALAQARTEQDLENELDETRWLLAGVLAVPAARVDELYRALGRRYREEHAIPDRST